MYIQTDKDSLVKLSTPEMDGVAEFSENNIAQVTKDDGTVLIDKFDHISEHNTDNA